MILRSSLLWPTEQRERRPAKLREYPERTVSRRLENPEFRAKISETRQEIYSQAVGSLASAAVEAVGVLQTLMHNAESEGIQRGAARDILQLGTALWSQLDLAVELSEIRARLDEVEEKRNAR